MPHLRALIINPYASDFKLYDEWMHPLGLYFLIDLLRQNGYAIAFFNCLERSALDLPKKFGTGEFPYEEIEKPPLYRAIPRKYKRYGRPLRELTAFLEAQPRPDLICIGSMMTYWIPGLVFTARLVARKFPGVPMVIGGCAARLMPAAIGAALPDARIFTGSLQKNGRVRLHPSRPDFVSGNEPSLAPALRTLRRLRHGPILTSLGCPLRCAFCASSVLQGPFRRRPLDTVVEEIRILAGYHRVTDLAFYDDALLFETGDYLNRFFTALYNMPESPRLHAPNGLHLNAVTDGLAAAMKAAGFVTLRFGYESGAPEHGRYVSSKASRHQVGGKIQCLERAGFERSGIGIYVMAGLPGQTPDHVLHEIRFLRSLGVKPKPVWFSPVPGTALFDHYARLHPAIAADPLWHNDLYFVTQLPGWNWEAMESIRANAAGAT